MISALIVYCSLALASLFTLAYFLSPKLRSKVEEPKHIFMEQLAQYDESNNAPACIEKELDNAG